MLFSEFVASLPTGAAAVVISYPPDQPMGYGELETFARGMLPSQPFILVGESFSGPLAIALAASYPTIVRGVVLVGSFVRSPIKGPPWLKSVIARVPIWRIPLRMIAAFAFGRWSSKTLRTRLSAAMAPVAPQAWRARLRAVLFVDASEALRSVRAPVLYLRGTSDRMVSRNSWQRIKELLPSARLAELDGPHFVLQARPVESAAQVAAFARKAGFAL